MGALAMSDADGIDLLSYAFDFNNLEAPFISLRSFPYQTSFLVHQLGISQSASQLSDNGLGS